MKTVVFQFDRPMGEVRTAISNAAKESLVIGDRIEIIIQPSFLDPFAGRGTIEFLLLSDDHGFKTKAICKIMPTLITQKGVYVLAFVLVLWTTLALVISFSIASILMVIVGWAMMLILIHFTQVLNEGKLENYLKLITSAIKVDVNRIV